MVPPRKLITMQNRRGHAMLSDCPACHCKPPPEHVMPLQTNADVSAAATSPFPQILRCAQHDMLWRWFLTILSPALSCLCYNKHQNISGETSSSLMECYRRNHSR